MAKNKQQKEQMVAAYQAYLKKASGLIVLNPKGVKPNEVNDFKIKLSELGGEYHVVKNTLFKIALSAAGHPELKSFEADGHAVIFAGQDIAATAKMLKEFMKDKEERLTVDSGLLEGQVLSASQVAELAEMPSKEDSVAMIAGLLNQSLSGVVNVLEDSVRSVAIIINQAFADKA